jgi:transcriptional regulator with PAS, ATPase and Fis domain
MTAIAERPSYSLKKLDPYDDLLALMACGLNVPDMFHQFSAVAARVVPHDEARLIVRSDDGSTFDTYATTGGLEEPVCRAEVGPPIDAAEQILDRVPGPEHGLKSGLKVPVRMTDRFVGTLGLFSRQPSAYTADDLQHAQRLASYLALAIVHQRLAEQTHDAAIERAASVEASVELLRTISDVLDIRRVFPRISEIANRILPHDAMTMVFLDESGRVVQEASTGGIPVINNRASQLLPDHFIIGDLADEELPVKTTGESSREKLLAAGFHSVLSVHTRARDQLMGVGFISKRRNGFSGSDVPVARRVVDHIVLAVSHEQLAEAARAVAEANTRADRLEARVQMLTEDLDSKTHNRVVGQSSQWLDVLKKATQVAATDTTVLLAGESGTGKEIVARFIHRASGRKNGPFVALNCAALPEQLLESELFGYERGAFTSAQQGKPGQIELAAGGVLFLDEVSEMSLASQAKFLRVLQEREFQRLGGTKMLRANIRVVAATNRDLRKAVERGDFREDLFYRLQVFDIRIVPLRERTSDILPLSEAFLQDIGKSFGRPPAGLTKDGRDALLAHTWPGNVRELRNALERAAILADGGLIHGEHLALHSGGKLGASHAATTDLDTVEREMISRVLHETRWNKSKAAKRLGVSRTQLYHRMRKYDLEEPQPQA